MARDEGRESRTYIDPVGERMTEEELRPLEEAYVQHKNCVVRGVPMLLCVWERAEHFRFKDGTYAYNNQEATPVAFKVNALGETIVMVEVEKRPSDDNELEVPMMSRMVMIPRLGGEVRVRNWPFKSRYHRTAASAQGEGIDELDVHGKEMTHNGVLYVSFSRATNLGGIRLSGVSRRDDLRKLLKPHPKVLVLLVALGRKIAVETLREAMSEIINSEEKWARAVRGARAP